MQYTGTETPEMVYIEEYDEDECGGVSFRRIARVPFIVAPKKSKAIMASVYGRRDDELKVIFGDKFQRVYDIIQRDWGIILAVDFIDDEEEDY